MSLAALREALKDQRVHTLAARVEVLDGETLHYHTNDEGDVTVSCLTLNGEMPVWANLGPMAGAAGNGVWWIPDPGTEVMLASDGGDIEGEVYLIACFPSGATPSGLAPGKVLVIGSTVEVRSKDGTAAKLPTFDDVKSIRDDLDGHSHTYLPGSGSAVTTTGNPSVTDPTGTTVLKAE